MLTETVDKFKKLYAEKKEIIDYLEKFGNDFEKIEAKILKEVALGF